MAKEEQTQQETEPITKKKGKGVFIKWLIIGVLVIFIIAGALAGGFYYFSSVSEGKEQQKSEKTAGILWPMEPFIVNLADNTGDRYLKAVIQLEVSGQGEGKENTKVLEELKPKFRDCVLDILSAKSYSELMDVNGKQRLRQDIANKLNSILSKGKIIHVYFTEFVIQ
jgi:flagellar FliL protein